MAGIKRPERGLRLFLLLYPVMALRFLYYGFTYFHQLDDYIQYHNYTAYGGSPFELVEALGLLAARPLAGLFDIFVWSRTYSFMILAVLLLTALHAFSAVLLYRIFNRHFGTGYVFLAIYCLLPLGFEGTYWVSASSRVVCGMFFAVLSVHLLQCYADSGKLRHLLLFGLCQLVSFGFYEQAMFLSFALMAAVLLLNWKKLGWRALSGLIWLLNLGIFFGFTSLVGTSTLYGQRMKLMLPDTLYYFEVFLPEVLGQMKSAFLGAGFHTTVRGFLRGAGILLADWGIWYVLLALLAAAGFFFFSRRERDEAEGRPPFGPGLAILFGILLAAAPAAPFFVLENPWFSLRGTVMSFAGVALLADGLLLLLLRLFRLKGKLLGPLLASLAAFVFLIGSVAELHDYKATRDFDMAVLQRGLVAAVEKVPDKRDIAVLGLNPSHLPEQNYFYHEHIHGVTESDWALTGALRAVSGNGDAPTVTPIATSRFIYKPYDRFGEFDYYLLYDGVRYVPVREREQGDGRWSFYDGAGTLRARVTRDEYGWGHLELTEE